MRRLFRAELWRDTAFVRFWSALTVSELGSQVTLVALPLAAVVVLHASAFEVALLQTAQIGPFLLFALPAGVWIDRLRRRPLMILADLVRAAALLSVPVAYWTSSLTLTQLYAVAAATGLLTVVFDVSFLSFLPALVGPGRLGAANESLLASQSAASLAGPSLGGAISGLLGAPVAMLADAVSFGVSGALIAAVRGRREEVAPLGERRRLRAELAEGLRYVFSQPYVRPIVLAASGWNLFSSAMFALDVVYFVRHLHLGQATVGGLFAVWNLGALIGALVAGRVARRFGVGRTIAVCGVCETLFLYAVPAAPLAHPIPVIAIAGLLDTTFGQIFNVNQLTLRQAVTPARLLGRMNSVFRFLAWGTRPLGAAIGGALATGIGVRATLFAGATGCVLVTVPLLLSRLRELERMPGEPALV